MRQQGVDALGADIRTANPKRKLQSLRGHVAEALEDRRLLSAYAVNPLSQLGINNSGANPQSALTLDANGNLFGSTIYGGKYGDGTVYEIASGSNVVTPLADFVDPQGQATGRVVVDQNGNVFGTTFPGGADDLGSIFEVVKGSGTVTTFFSFTHALGADPPSGLIADAQDDLYGTTQLGGVNNEGSVFELPAGSPTITILASSSAATGYSLNGDLVMDANGDLFGTTNSTVFEVVAGSGTITTLATFSGYPGLNPGVALDGNGNLFGSTQNGGTSNDGALFEIAKGSGTATTLASFTGVNGFFPTIPWVDPHGNLFGTTLNGGANGHGVVFELPAGSGTIADLASIGVTTDVSPGSVLMDGAGRLYCGTIGGGAAGSGSVFMLPPGGNAITTIASFDPTNGKNPNDGLSVDRDGNLWGTTTSGGVAGDGVLFEVDNLSGQVTDVASFDGLDGDAPNGNVVIDDEGNVFGTTNRGGADGQGVVFEYVQATGALQPIVSFDVSNGQAPAGGLTADGKGNMYGTAVNQFGMGVIFEITAGTHAFDTLAVFDNSISGSPSGPLAMDGLGDLYGTTSMGSVFEWAVGSASVSQVASILFPLNSGLVIDAEGNIYGTNMYGGANRQGSVFEIAKGSGVGTTIAQFDVSTIGEWPNSELFSDGAGDLFGSLQYTSATPGSSAGEIFEIASGSDTAIPLASVPYFNIGSPRAIVRDSDGGFRGVSSGGLGYGVFFEATPAAPAITLRRDKDNLHIDWTIGADAGQTAISDIRGLSLAGDGGNDLITLDYTNGNPLPRMLHLEGTFTISGLQGDNPLAGTTLEIGQSTIYFAYSPGSSPAASIRQYLGNGYQGGLWYGFATASSGAIMSPSAGGIPGRFALGYADSADGVVAGQPANTIEVRYTLAGDANLDGVVNLNDAMQMTRNWGAAGSPAWDQGNFNYDSAVDLADATVLQQNWNATVTAPASSSVSDVIPVVGPAISTSTPPAPAPTVVAPPIPPVDPPAPPAASAPPVPPPAAEKSVPPAPSAPPSAPSPSAPPPPPISPRTTLVAVATPPVPAVALAAPTPPKNGNGGAAVAATPTPTSTVTAASVLSASQIGSSSANAIAQSAAEAQPTGAPTPMVDDLARSKRGKAHAKHHKSWR